MTTPLPVRDLTGGQVEELIDTLLYGALRPIVEHTDLFSPQLAFILSLIVSNKKRKPCTTDVTTATYYLVRALHAPRDQRMQFICKVGLERNFISMFLHRVLEKYHKPFMQNYGAMLSAHAERREKDALVFRQRVDTLVVSSGASSRTALYTALTRVQLLLPEFMYAFDSVVGNFANLCARLAHDHVKKNPNHQYDVRDVTQNFLRATITALNKYSSKRGAHASYVKWWIFNAQTCGSNDHEYGLSYTIPQSQRKKIAIGGATQPSAINFSVSLDQPSGDEEDEGSSLHSRIGGSSQDLEHDINMRRQALRIAEVAKAVDPFGVWRVALDMEEPFSAEEIALMDAHMASQKSVKRI